MQCLQIKVQLLGTKKINYRTFQFPIDYTFQDLHNCIIEAFGFDGYHLWNFHYGDRNYEVEISPIFQDIEPIFSEHREASKTTLKEIFIDKKINKLEYEYDYGDSWKFSVQLQDIGESHTYEVELLKTYGPILLEDVGGVSGFYKLLEDYKKGVFNEDLFDDWDDFEGLIEDSLMDYNISDFSYKK